MQAEGQVVARVSVDGLEEAEHDPEVHREDMEVVCYGAVEERCGYCPESEDHDFDWRCVFCGHAERRGVLVVDFVDVFVRWSPV